mgnify:FL=1
MERRNAWLSYTEAEEKELEQVAKAYRNFLNVGKTERECVTQIIREARAAGYESLEEKTAKGEKLKAGDKVYLGKACMRFYGVMNAKYKYGRRGDLNYRQVNKYSIVTSVESLPRMP